MATVSDYVDRGETPRTAVVANVALWLMQILVALAFAGAGSAKLSGNVDMVAMFDAIGVGQWFRFVTGGLEIVGALLLLTRATVPFGALLLACVMVGAIATHLAVLHNSPVGPLVLLVMTGLIAWRRWPSQRRAHPTPG